MGHSQFDDASRERAAWNAGKLVGTKRPLTQKQIVNRHGNLPPYRRVILGQTHF